MIPRLVALALVAAALLAWERALGRAPAESGAAPAVERLLPESRARELAVAGLSLSGAGPREILYTQQGGVWRCASAFGAVALEAEVRAVVGDLIEAAGLLRTDDPARQSEYGFDAPGMLTVALHGPRLGSDPERDRLLSYDLGRSLPGLGGGRSFARPSGTRAIHEIQRDPRALLESTDGLPPLLDRRVLAGEWPGAGEGVARAFVDFDGGSSLELVLRRTPPERLLPGRPAEEWVAIRDGEEFACLPFRVAAWQAFLFQVGYGGFADPADAARLGFAEGARVRLSLFLTDGSPIELAVGRTTRDGRIFVSNEKTGMLCLVAPAHAPLFAPDVDMLSETSIANPWEEWLRR